MKNFYNNALSALKRRLMPNVSEQTKKNIIEKENIYSYNSLLRRQYDDTEQIDREHNEIKRLTMTYIVPGIINNQPFLMVDSIVTDKTGLKLFSNKLTRLKTTKQETFCCLTGVDALKKAILIFDDKCYENDIEFDYTDPNHIKEIFEFYLLLIKRTEYNSGHIITNHFSRIYFINRDGIFFYTVDKDMNLTSMYTINNNQYIKSEVSNGLPINIPDTSISKDELIDFCYNDLLETHTKINPNLSIKNRYSFLMLGDTNKEYITPCKNNDEIVLAYVNSMYTELNKY